MIEFIRLWGTALVCAAFVSAICGVLLPKNSLSKIARFVVGLFLVLTVIAPFAKNSFDFEQLRFDLMPEISVETSLSQGMLIAETTENLNRKIEQILSDEGITADVDCGLKIDADNRILFDLIVIYINSDAQVDIDSVEQLVLQHCGTRPLVLPKEYHETG